MFVKPVNELVRFHRPRLSFRLWKHTIIVAKCIFTIHSYCIVLYYIVLYCIVSTWQMARCHTQWSKSISWCICCDGCKSSIYCSLLVKWSIFRQQRNSKSEDQIALKISVDSFTSKILQMNKGEEKMVTIAFTKQDQFWRTLMRKFKSFTNLEST